MIAAARPIVLPSRTPFDTAPDLRGAFLRGFDEGFKMGLELKTIHATVCFEAPKNQEDVAAIMGFNAGTWEVWKIVCKIEDQIDQEMLHELGHD